MILRKGKVIKMLIKIKANTDLYVKLAQVYACNKNLFLSARVSAMHSIVKSYYTENKVDDSFNMNFIFDYEPIFGMPGFINDLDNPYIEPVIVDISSVEDVKLLKQFSEYLVYEEDMYAINRNLKRLKEKGYHFDNNGNWTRTINKEEE